MIMTLKHLQSNIQHSIFLYLKLLCVWIQEWQPEVSSWKCMMVKMNKYRHGHPWMVYELVSTWTCMTGMGIISFISQNSVSVLKALHYSYAKDFHILTQCFCIMSHFALDEWRWTSMIE